MNHILFLAFVIAMCIAAGVYCEWTIRAQERADRQHSQRLRHGK